MKLNLYDVRVLWTGNDGAGTRSYQSYRRDHEIAAKSKAVIAASSDPTFRGDPGRYNPEELFVSSLASCHMLWYLHLCAVNRVVVLEYSDAAVGEMQENDDGSGQFVRVTLHPRVRIDPGSDPVVANQLHHPAHENCFLARSVNFPVLCEPRLD